MEAKHAVALVLDFSTFEKVEAPAPEPPIQPAPLPDQDQVSAGLQHPSDLTGMQAATGLREEIEEPVRIGEGPRPAGLEGDPPLGIEAGPRYRLADRLLGRVDATYSGGGKLAGKEENPLAFAATDLEDPLRPLGQVENRGGKGDE